MSRTHNTDPYYVQGYRERGDRCPTDWRERALVRNCPVSHWEDPAAWNAWWDETCPSPDKDWHYSRRGSLKKDRNLVERRYRAHVRDAIKREAWDEADIKITNLKGWLWWLY